MVFMYIIFCTTPSIIGIHSVKNTPVEYFFSPTNNTGFTALVVVESAEANPGCMMFCLHECNFLPLM